MAFIMIKFGVEYTVFELPRPPKGRGELDQTRTAPDERRQVSHGSRHATVHDDERSAAAPKMYGRGVRMHWQIRGVFAAA